MNRLDMLLVMRGIDRRLRALLGLTLHMRQRVTRTIAMPVLHGIARNRPHPRVVALLMHELLAMTA